ncbi:heat shock protein-related protein [Deinococcus proteolyticus MRP]|uniref:Heat shock protein-related protein n=1 Tax=Deinococcus proteolyticus (strain ATCC 35074 / DSM 20540 / JCM 6276 / NBRC 101906 / NCIMB 13154 / VKM Ac-1939 / CCM 2703 / MRP) TaxID=693977 RepID=F0RLD6_DEIPM|nr:Hsp20/alpha crystallin family protein [Deinococcus proteolyticus]ADY25840.1 heat shock protein-related protein [Deinococcus proteolyticus MRP]
MNEPTLARLQQLMTVREEAEGLLGYGETRGFTPAADWLDGGAHLTLLLDVPAVEAQSLEMEEDGDRLTVAGVRTSLPPGAGRLLQSERRAGAFSRTLVFPEPVVPGSGEASLEAGVLRVRFTKLHPTIDAACHELDTEDEKETEGEQR